MQKTAQAPAPPPRQWARLSWIGNVAILAMERAPTNALGAQFCGQISALITTALAQDHSAGLVLRSDLAGFSSGADVGDLLSPPAQNRAAFAQLCRQISRAHKPVVAAVHGDCLSAGFDLALAAQGRVAGPQARFGFPEARLGLLPAGGGVYRLTRLIGAQRALDMLLSSKSCASAAALDIGLIDALCAGGDEVAQAAALVQDLAKNGPRARRDYGANLREDMAAIAQFRTKMPAQTGPWVAQHRAVDCAEAALLLPEDSALAQEQTSFDAVQRGPIAGALSYAFVARERARFVQETSLAAAASIEHATEQYRRIMAQIVAYFTAQNMARPDILGAMAAFGMGIPAGMAVPDCPIGAEDVMPALLAAWANMGVKLLREGAISSAFDLDYAALSAGMCPNWQGGPMYLAAKTGALVLRRDLTRRAQEAGAEHRPLFAPDPLWDVLVSSGQGVLDYRT